MTELLRQNWVVQKAPVLYTSWSRERCSVRSEVKHLLIARTEAKFGITTFVLY